ncbi:unnamed protein product [Pleuronectes platessa]|uniref:Uncharacterized protein n=1 Tax=Pleuronectes platessa TaxID=8262 RepID=A0A9N7V983_PLEPL|nr:unnamed protein product [Pleuronectes platessa]
MSADLRYQYNQSMEKKEEAERERPLQPQDQEHQGDGKLCKGSGRAELRAGCMSDTSGGGPKGREPMAGQSPEPNRTAGKCPAPTEPHQELMESTTLSLHRKGTET